MAVSLSDNGGRDTGSPIVNLTSSPGSPLSAVRKPKNAGDANSRDHKAMTEPQNDAKGVSLPEEDSHAGEALFWSRVNAVAQGSERVDPHELRKMLKMVVERAENSGRVNGFGAASRNQSSAKESVPESPQACCRRVPNNGRGGTIKWSSFCFAIGR